MKNKYITSIAGLEKFSKLLIFKKHEFIKII